MAIEILCLDSVWVFCNEEYKKGYWEINGNVRINSEEFLVRGESNQPVILNGRWNFPYVDMDHAKLKLRGISVQRYRLGNVAHDVEKVIYAEYEIYRKNGEDF